jgi:hypothetical protein
MLTYKDYTMLPRPLLALAITLSVLTAGCQSLVPKWPANWFGKDEKPQVTESKYPRPARMAVIWTPAMLNTPGKKPTRGFGGRVYFYDGQNKAVPVEGQLVVYGYDDTRATNESRNPDRKFAFTPEQFTTHFSPTELGASYSIWIPWDEVGNNQVDVSLVPIFTATSGQLIVGQSSKAVLAGPNSPAHESRVERTVLPPPVIQREGPSAVGSIQQATYQESVPGMVVQSLNSNLQETSIALPGTMAGRLAKAPPQTMPALRPRETSGNAAPSTSGASVQSPATMAQTAPPAAMALPTIGEHRPQSTRSEPAARPAPFWPGPRPASDRLPKPPYPATPPSALP